MQQFILDVVDYLKEALLSNNIVLGFFIAFCVVIVESILPIVPLAVFIALNLLVFGNIAGFLISWVATIIGCSISFLIFRKGVSKQLYAKLENKPRTERLMNVISNISFSKLVIIMAIPFTPAFSVNIGAGLSKLSYKKFLAACIIAKLAMVYFWGFVGTTLAESITDITVIVKLLVILMIAFILSKFVINKFDLD